jgi:hypothetical protein
VVEGLAAGERVQVRKGEAANQWRPGGPSMGMPFGGGGRPR